MTERERELYNLLRENPMMPQSEIAQRLGIKRSSVAVHILNLTRKGWIAGKGYVLNSGRYIVVVGGAGMDLTGFSKLPMREAESNPGQTTLTPGGVGRNISENLARIGLGVYLMSAVGEDMHGQLLLNRCREAGIDTRATLRVPEIPTSLYIAMIEPSGEMKIALSSMNILEKIDVEAVRKQDALLSTASAIVLDANLPAETLSYLTQHYKHRPIYVDPVSAVKATRLSCALSGIDTLKPNQAELEALVGLRTKTVEEVEIAAKKLCERGVRRVVVSMGAAGAVSVTRHKTLQLEAATICPVNTTGAGDAFMAGLIYADLNDFDERSALLCAATMAEITLESPGAISMTLTENLLKERLAAHGVLRKERLE